ncbi:hypothetical protein ES703_89315 [subsurface metagenome]
MAKINTAVRMPRDIISWIDKRVEERIFSSRTHAFEYALRQLMKKEALQRHQFPNALHFNTDYINKDPNLPIE